MTSAQRFASEWLANAQFARTCTERDEPGPAWSTGEVLAVAVILRDTPCWARLGYTEVEALERLRYGIDKSDLNTAAQWFADIGAQL